MHRRAVESPTLILPAMRHPIGSPGWSLRKPAFARDDPIRRHLSQRHRPKPKTVPAYSRRYAPRICCGVISFIEWFYRNGPIDITDMPLISQDVARRFACEVREPTEREGLVATYKSRALNEVPA